MDKKNDIQVYKISKWEAAPKNMGTLVTYIDLVIGMACSLPPEIRDNLYDLMDKTLDEYNELEAKYQEACGMISQYEEENRTLQKQRKKLANANNKVAEDNHNLRRECVRHIDLLDKLRWALEDKGICCEWNERALKWNLYDNANICESCKKHFEDELRIRCEEIDNKNKLIDELNETARHECEELHEKIEALEKENNELKTKNRNLQIRANMVSSFYGLNSTHGELNKKIEALKKENKELKDTLNKDGEFGKNIGKCVADSIREGCDKGVYELHPCARIDIHVEETNSIPINIPFGRYAIPRISVIFNNTQTEMERDTAQHECEELNEKIKELAKENIDLKTTLAMIERDAIMAREQCHTIAFNAERARNKTSWFNDICKEEK